MTDGEWRRQVSIQLCCWRLEEIKSSALTELFDFVCCTCITGSKVSGQLTMCRQICRNGIQDGAYKWKEASLYRALLMTMGENHGVRNN